MDIEKLTNRLEQVKTSIALDQEVIEFYQQRMRELMKSEAVYKQKIHATELMIEKKLHSKQETQAMIFKEKYGQDAETIRNELSND